MSDWNKDAHEFRRGDEGSLCAAMFPTTNDGYAACGKSKNARPHRPFWVNVYQLNQSFGGPEEGGWYYETGEPVLTIRLNTERSVAEAVRDALLPIYPDRRQRYSVMPQDEDYGVLIERYKGIAYPKYRPHYE